MRPFLVAPTEEGPGHEQGEEEEEGVGHDHGGEVTEDGGGDEEQDGERAGDAIEKLGDDAVGEADGGTGDEHGPGPDGDVEADGGGVGEGGSGEVHGTVDGPGENVEGFEEIGTGVLGHPESALGHHLGLNGVHAFVLLSDGEIALLEGCDGVEEEGGGDGDGEGGESAGAGAWAAQAIERAGEAGANGRGCRRGARRKRTGRRDGGGP